jgi:predicted alpha/beta superfamily hydrolase
MKITAIKILFFFFAFVPFAHSQGKVVTIDDFKSEYVRPRNVEIWLPDEYYNGSEQSFPVLYMHDGQNVFNDDTAMHNTSWQAGKTAEHLIRQEAVKPFIIVASWSTQDRFFEYFPEEAAQYLSEQDMEQLQKIGTQMGIKKIQFLGDEYLEFLTKELKPYIDSEYRTKSGPESTSICGSSMGGLISLYAICQYPDVFGQAACVSTHWPILFDNDNMGPAQAITKYLEPKIPSPANHRLYFDYGTETLDQYYEEHQKVVDGMIKQAGYTPNENWVTKKFEGAEHNEKSWSERFDSVLLFLYQEKQ